MYERDFGSMLQDFHDFMEDFDDIGAHYEVVAWSLFEAIEKVLGSGSHDARQIARLSAAISAFFEENLETAKEELDDERSEIAA